MNSGQVSRAKAIKQRNFAEVTFLQAAFLLPDCYFLFCYFPFQNIPVPLLFL